MILGNSGESGFTLTELLIGIVLSGVVIAGVYGFFVSQIKTYSLQEQLVEMQENARIAIDTIVMGLQNAGYDPTSSDKFGITTAAFSASNSAGLSLTTSTELYFTVNEDEDANGVIANNDSERFGFKLDSGSLGAASILDTDGSITGWDPIADNIDVLSFTYTYANGTASSGTTDLPSNSVAGKNFADIREVAISLTGKTSLPDPSYTHPTEGDNYRRLTLSAEVSPRNLAY
jgi:type IV pilus assembly protein PilW